MHRSRSSDGLFLPAGDINKRPHLFSLVLPPSSGAVAAIFGYSFANSRRQCYLRTHRGRAVQKRRLPRPRPPFRPCTDRFETREIRTSSRHTTRPALFHPLSAFPPGSWSSCYCFPAFSFLSREVPPRTFLLEKTPFFFLDFLRPRNRTREPRGGANRWWLTGRLALGEGVAGHVTACQVESNGRTRPVLVNDSVLLGGVVGGMCVRRLAGT